MYVRGRGRGRGRGDDHYDMFTSLLKAISCNRNINSLLFTVMNKFSTTSLVLAMASNDWGLAWANDYEDEWIARIVEENGEQIVGFLSQA